MNDEHPNKNPETRWLIVFDNVESVDLLNKYWPPTTYTGQVIVTARNGVLAAQKTEEAMDVPSWDAENGSKFLLYLLARAIGDDIAVSEEQSALELSRKLDGHAQAITTIAGIINESSSTVKDFLRKYQKNPRRALVDSTRKSALDAIFELSFKSLIEESSTLLGIFSFLMPDKIAFDTFVHDDDVDNMEGDSWDDLPDALQFCSDEFEFVLPIASTSSVWLTALTSRFDDALRHLLTLALVVKNPVTKVMSVHRMVQTQYQFFMTPAQRQKSFSHAAFLIWRAFPKQDATEVQLYKKWKACEKYIQHVLALKDAFKEQVKQQRSFRAPLDFVNLMLACERYVPNIT